ncbi:DNA translocase FtsK 4TM domain-containing protein, partial [Candidatus Parcubacteria bacterium]|nr:DNA translocase FtsK 4TM domain-containing protein [Candidatus Parcubacteria bacterium]
MAKKNGKKEKEAFSLHRLNPGLKEETVHAVLAILSFIIAVLFVFAAFGKGGVAGAFIFRFLTMLFGIGYYLLPALFLMLGISYARSVRPNVGFTHLVGSFLFLFAGLGIIDITMKDNAGGIVGGLVSYPLLSLIDLYASLTVLAGLLVISLLVIFDARPSRKLFNFFLRHHDEGIGDEEDEEDVEPMIAKEESSKPEEKPREEKRENPLTKILGVGKKDADEILMSPPSGKSMRHFANYTPPPLSIFEKDRGKPDVGDIKANANIIKRTLQNFGIDVEMDEVSIGPTVTRYALKPAEGVKLARIVGLKNDLALALAAHPIRIEAPIPGKSLVGVEIPNTVKATVGLATLFSDEKFTSAAKPLTLALGRAVSGKSVFVNLGKMPHLLIAGATGSGKSVTIHTIVNSLLFRNSPEDLRFIMIDPKRVELTLYNKIPHLLTPVITDAKKAILSLKWAAKEMERRYDVLETESVRDIESYHQNVVLPAYGKDKARGKSDEFVELPERMPYIIIVLDELADIMSTYPRELEAGIVRLAQMSRAVGIHLILSTQRPSVNVITGLIKANIPGRVALQVSSQIDSRTILDTGGAETLLGAGDMLYISGEMSKPERVQSAYISEGEVKKVTSYLANAYKDEVPDEIVMTEGTPGSKSIFEATLDG